MNCADFEQDIALAAAGCLEPDRWRLLRAHTRSCAACGERLRALEAIGQGHRAAAQEVQSIPLRLRPEIATRRPGLRGRASGWTIPVWRWVLPLGAAALLALMLFRDRAPGPPVKTNPPALTAEVAAPVSLNSLPASLGRYRQASQDGAGDALETLLAQDADRLLRPSPAGERLRVGELLSSL